MIQTPPAAREFYSRKVEELGKSLQDLEKIVQGKQGNLSVVEDGEFTYACLLPGSGKGGSWFGSGLIMRLCSFTAESY